MILEARNIIKDFTGHRALDDVSISVPEGKVYGLLGPNGAGKTTLIRIINHITAPDSGEVIFDGHRLTQADVAHIGYLPEERGLYKKMRVGEQALFFAQLKGLKKKEAEAALHQWFERLDIDSWWGKKVEELSKGMAQKVQFVITVLHRPKLLIFDEPFSGFDPINAQLLKNEILRLKDEGATVIFSTHNMSSVEEICDNITLINKSRNILTGKVDEIRRHYGHNQYRLTFEGDPASLIQAVEPFCSQCSLGEDEKDNRKVVSIKLAADEVRRQVIEAANQAVDLFSFAPQMVSMNDIFIRAVGENNQTLPPEFNTL